MKKLLKKSKKIVNKNINKKLPKKKILNNPEVNWLEKKLNNLINENVVLNFEIRSKSTTQTPSSVNHSKIPYNSYYGILVFGPHKSTPSNKTYSFQFNPLDQHLYQSKEDYVNLRLRSPVNIYDYNEQNSVDELNLILDVDLKPTYEFEFIYPNVCNINENKIYLWSGVKFEPKLID